MKSFPSIEWHSIWLIDLRWLKTLGEDASSHLNTVLCALMFSQHSVPMLCPGISYVLAISQYVLGAPLVFIIYNKYYLFSLFNHTITCSYVRM